MDGLVWHVGNLRKSAKSADGIEDLRGDLSSDE